MVNMRTTRRRITCTIAVLVLSAGETVAGIKGLSSDSASPRINRRWHHVGTRVNRQDRRAATPVEILSNQDRPAAIALDDSERSKPLGIAFVLTLSPWTRRAFIAQAPAE